MTNTEELKDLIEQELSFCDSDNTPYICSCCSTPEGKQKIVDTVFEYCLRLKIDVSEAILKLETNFNPNIADNPYV